MVKDAMRPNPRYPLWYRFILARALEVAGQPKDALETLDGILAQQPNFFTAILLRTGILAKEGRENDAKEAMTELQRINPNFRLAHAPDFFMNRDQEYVAAVTATLPPSRAAGIAAPPSSSGSPINLP
ncbi:MAG: tetratricopeptide repeat protein [Acidobacteria bacterium]|nr:tetratricopeptide repeat protein [Acidobacteriota bacterium]